MTTQRKFEIDIGFPEAWFEYETTWEESDPSVGFVGGWVVSGHIDHWTIGNIKLTRDQLCFALGGGKVDRLEKHFSQVVSDKLNGVV